MGAGPGTRPAGPMTSGDGPDRIEVRGLRVVGTHGLLPEEQHRGQLFEIDLDITADLTAAGRTDALEDTVDYGEVVRRTSEVVSGRSHRLIEALAEAIAEAVLTDARATSVTVGTRA